MVVDILFVLGILCFFALSVWVITSAYRIFMAACFLGLMACAFIFTAAIVNVMLGFKSLWPAVISSLAAGAYTLWHFFLRGTASPADRYQPS